MPAEDIRYHHLMAGANRAGYLLVGGQSSRMGRDKALLPIEGGQTFLEHISSEIQKSAGSVKLIGDYKKYSLPGYRDVMPGNGPLGGVFTALHYTPAKWNLIVACDMPFVTAELFESLFAAAEAGDFDCIAAGHDGQIEPLCAVYHNRCAEAALSAIERKSLKMHDFVSGLKTFVQHIEKLPALANINTPADLAAANGSAKRSDTSHYIEFRNVYKTFDQPVLVDVSFHVDPGETLAIIGRSGVGKSVTLGHIMGFIKPTRGRVFVSYLDITDMEEAELRKIRKKVTMVFQSGALFDSLTVGENILFSLELRDDYNEQNKEDVVDGLLQMVDLAEYKDHYPSDLSTGYKRAVAIARALAAQPECILYDEPTTMVDPIMSDHIGNLMLRLKNQLRLTSVVVTHDLDLMYKVADRVVFLSEGRSIFFGPLADLEKSTDPNIQEFLAMDRV